MSATIPEALARRDPPRANDAAYPRRPSMAPPSPKLVDLAQRIVEQEADGSPDPAASAAAVETACRRLKDHLVDLLGSGGVSALLRRALHLAQREQPLLAGVAVSGESAACFIGLEESLAASTEEEATAAAATVLTHMLDLLVMLLGEELGMKPIRKLWPHATTAREIDE
jgi:hypothetical protein